MLNLDIGALIWYMLKLGKGTLSRYMLNLDIGTLRQYMLKLGKEALIWYMASPVASLWLPI